MTVTAELMLAKLRDSVSKFTEMWGSLLRFISWGGVIRWQCVIRCLNIMWGVGGGGGVW